MRPSPINVLVLPCAGASATMYLRWRPSLPDWIRLIPVELPGRGARLSEPCVTDFAQLVGQLCEEQAQAMRQPYALFGHSMGALLAYGIAVRQRSLARPLPSILFASASPAPSRQDPKRFAGKNNDAALIADLRTQGGTPEEVFASPELLRLTLDILGADYRLCESLAYTATEPLPIPIHVFAGLQDSIAVERLEAWRDETKSAFSLTWFEGQHFFIRAQEHKVLTRIVHGLEQVAVLA